MHLDVRSQEVVHPIPIWPHPRRTNRLLASLSYRLAAMGNIKPHLVFWVGPNGSKPSFL